MRQSNKYVLFLFYTKRMFALYVRYFIYVVETTINQYFNLKLTVNFMEINPISLPKLKLLSVLEEKNWILSGSNLFLIKGKFANPTH